MVTLGQIGKIRIDGRPRFPEAIWSYSYNDRPLADTEIPKDGTKEHDRCLELLALVYGLGHFERGVQIEDRVDGVPGKQEHPDFFITLESGQLIGAEITRLTDPNRTAEWNLIEKLNAAFAQALANDRVLAARYDHVSLSIQVAIRQPKMYDAKELLRAILNRLRTKADSAIRPQHIDRMRQGGDPTLCEHSFSLAIAQRHDRWTEITPHIHIDALDGEARLLERIADKIERSTKYDRRAPLWLVVPIADPWGQYSYPIEQFVDSHYEIAPFERLILTDNMRSMIKFAAKNAAGA